MWLSGVVFTYLLHVSLCVRQLSGHMEHHLFVAVVAVDGLGASLPVSHIQATTETARTQRGYTPHHHHYKSMTIITASAISRDLHLVSRCIMECVVPSNHNRALTL